MGPLPILDMQAKLLLALYLSIHIQGIDLLWIYQILVSNDTSHKNSTNLYTLSSRSLNLIDISDYAITI